MTCRNSFCRIGFGMIDQTFINVTISYSLLIYGKFSNTKNKQVLEKGLFDLDR